MKGKAKANLRERSVRSARLTRAPRLVSVSTASRCAMRPSAGHRARVFLQPR